MNAIVTVVGKDRVGIIAAICNKLADYNVNILDISQSVLQDVFAMVMLVDISKSNIPFSQLVDTMDSLGKSMGLSIHTMHESIFKSMHTI